MFSLNMLQVASLNDAAAAIEEAIGPVEAMALVVKHEGVEWSVVRQGRGWKVDTTKIVSYSNGDRQLSVLL